MLTARAPRNARDGRGPAASKTESSAGSHTVICTFLFYGWGLGLFGTMDRFALMFVALAIWIFQLVVSPVWLRHFRFGPAEWLWRSLTYFRRQPMRVSWSPALKGGDR